MNCKKCNAEMAEGMKFCPACGTAQGSNGLGAGKIALLVILAVAAIAVIAALVMGGSNGAAPVETTTPVTTPATTEAVSAEPTVPADGNPDDVTCKGTYAVSDDEMVAAASTVVATMGEIELTNADLQVFYWMQVYDFLNQYGSYASMFGLDVSQPLDTQLCLDGTMTWQQYFLDAALDTWINYQAMTQEAKANDFVLTDEYAIYLEDLPEELATNAVSMGFESADAMVQADMGVGAKLDNYMNYLNVYYLGYMYYTDTLENLPITDSDVLAYFEAHEAEYKENGLEKTDETYVDVRHILVAPKSATGASTYTDEEWAAAEAKAGDILEEWLTKHPDEDGFSVLAEAYSEDPGSASNGGLYEGVYVGQMVEPFEEWCFAEGRQYGDYGIVKTSYGYHIMFFVGSEYAWFVTAEQDMMVEKGNEFLADVLEKHSADIDYSAIVLGNVNLATAG